MITIGHDSEFGIEKGGVLLSALDYLEPFETEDGRGFPDNMPCEIAINPVTTLKEFHSKTEGLLNVVRDRGFDIVIEPTLKYPDEAMENPLAYISGCNPDFSAYSMRENRAPDFEKADSTRSFGGHIHAGVDGLDPHSFARWMDVYVGLPLLLVEKKNNRRAMYGGAGCLRVKEYGAEYRTLSNIWLLEPERREFVWENTHKVIEICNKKDMRDLEAWSDIPIAIDSHDIELTKQTIDRLEYLGVSTL